MRMHDTNNLPYLKSMMSCLGRVITNGYVEDFTVSDQGLFSKQRKHFYAPGEVKVVSSFLFEGFSNPAENAMVYVLETADGGKGTLVDACGPLADPGVNKFMTAVSNQRKKS